MTHAVLESAAVRKHIVQIHSLCSYQIRESPICPGVALQPRTRMGDTRKEAGPSLGSFDVQRGKSKRLSVYSGDSVKALQRGIRRSRNWPWCNALPPLGTAGRFRVLFREGFMDSVCRDRRKTNFFATAD